MGDFSFPLWLVTGMIGFVAGAIFMVFAYKHIEDPIPPPDTQTKKEHYQ